jgi:hypothetical protein
MAVWSCLSNLSKGASLIQHLIETRPLRVGVGRGMQSPASYSGKPGAGIRLKATAGHAFVE